MEANAGFEPEKVVKYRRGYEGKIILLFEMGITRELHHLLLLM